MGIIKPDGLFLTLDLTFTCNLGHLFYESCFWIMSENKYIFPTTARIKQILESVCSIDSEVNALFLNIGDRIV